MTGYFIDEMGHLQSCAEVRCQVWQGVVQVLGETEPDGSREVLGEFTYYPTLAAIRAIPPGWVLTPTRKKDY